MTDFRAHIRRAFVGGEFNQIEVFISSNRSDISGNYSNYVKEIGGTLGTIYEHIPEGTEIPFKVHMNEDVAKALMLGLLEYFGEYKGDVRILRQDYQAERERVDEFIKFLTRPQ